MSHVTILCASQVCRFFVMCQGIMNNPVFKMGMEGKAPYPYIRYLLKLMAGSKGKFVTSSL
jgi:hypothetical protein